MRQTKNRSGGSIAVIMRNSISNHARLKRFDSASIEGVELRLNVGKTSSTIAYIYRRTNTSKHKVSHNAFFDEFTDILSEYTNESREFAIHGDFNFHYDDLSSNDTQHLKTILSDYNLKQLINKPIHQKGHILDWLVVPEERNLWSLEKISNYPGVSDHKAIFSFLHIKHPPKLTRSVSSRNLKGICHHSFENDVRKCINDINIDDSDIDSLTCTYNDGLKNILDNHAPIVTRTVRDRASTEWMDDEAREARRVLRRAERKYRKTNLTVYEDIYKNELKTYRKIKVQLRKQYNSNKISACSTTKQVHVTSDLLLGKKKTKILPDKIEKNLLPENFSKYFTNNW